MVGRLPQHTDFTLLHHLLVLIEMRSVSRAADRLGIGQPAMSRILARLRDQFADALLVRGPRGMTLTPRAEALSGPLRNWLRDGENLLREPELNLQQVRRSFHLASTDYGALTVLAPTLAQIEREALGIGLTVEPLSDASVRRLEEGQLDLLLTGWDPQAPACSRAGCFRRIIWGWPAPITRFTTAARRRMTCCAGPMWRRRSVKVSATGSPMRGRTWPTVAFCAGQRVSH